MMSSATLRFCLGLTAWVFALLGALSISQVPGDWGHWICGPWGCGPPLQALAACHFAWLVVMGPPAVWLRQSNLLSTRMVRRCGVALMMAGVLGLSGVVIYQRTMWWPGASEWQQPYFWHRCGFVIGTTVDVPIMQSVLIGSMLLLLRNRRPVPAWEAEAALETGRAPVPAEQVHHFAR